MSRRMYGRGITAAALVAALALASPVHAAGRSGWEGSGGYLLHAWEWLVGGWSVAGARVQGRVEMARPSMNKEGAGVDPDGRQVPGTAPRTNATSPADREIGAGPNG